MILCKRCFKDYDTHMADDPKHLFDRVYAETLILEQLARIIELMELREERDSH